jgi:membrane associated rhomboid family serine protease
MGIYDRDYYRRDGPSFLGALADRGRVCKWLILLNVIVFVVQIATLERAEGGQIIGEGSFTTALLLDPNAVLHGEVWRLLTYSFLHSYASWAHIVFNMLFLWWMGSEMEEMYGSREFLTLYLVSAVVAGVAYFLTQLPLDPWARHGCLGASGAVVAVTVLFACHFPHRTVLLMFLFPVPIWVLVLLFVGQDFLTFLLKMDSQVAVGAHLGGAVFGFLYYKGHWRLSNLVPDLKAWRKRRARPKLRIYREEEPQTPVAVGAPPDNDIEHLEAKLDAVLEKMSQVGKENLTESERQILLRASEIYRRRRT